MQYSSQAPEGTPHHHAPEEEWQALVDSATPACRQLVAEVADRHAEALSDRFYAVMMAHPRAGAFLAHDVVHERLRASMARWIREIYGDRPSEVATLVAHQRHVGEVHARIQLPIHLVARGARTLKRALADRLAAACNDVVLRQEAERYAGLLMDLAQELMSEAYMRNTQRGARTDEAYRLFSLGQNMSVERERQRSVLLEWGQELLFALHRAPTIGALPRLAHSEFGLWFNHKAAAMFEGAPELDSITEIIERVDDTLLPQLSGQGQQAGQPTPQLIMTLQTELDNLKFQLNTLFERQLEVENGRDTLTRLLNRRFLPSVMSREIKLANERHTQFALLLIDVDHFKRINDEEGHDAGDMVLQQAAMLVLNSVRNGDFVFRYGGEELLVMLVEVTPPVAQRIAQDLCERFAATDFLVGQGRKLHVTVSVGVAVYDGHPDFQHLINRADQAMYEAKQGGRNQVCLAR